VITRSESSSLRASIASNYISFSGNSLNSNVAFVLAHEGSRNLTENLAWNNREGRTVRGGHVQDK